jgi:hypothetical protein
MRRLPIRGQPFAKRPMRLPMSSSMSLRTRLWASTPLRVHAGARDSPEIGCFIGRRVHVRRSLAPRSDVLSASVLNCTAPTPHLWGGQSTVGTELQGYSRFIHTGTFGLSGSTSVRIRSAKPNFDSMHFSSVRCSWVSGKRRGPDFYMYFSQFASPVIAPRGCVCDGPNAADSDASWHVSEHQTQRARGR